MSHPRPSRVTGSSGSYNAIPCTTKLRLITRKQPGYKVPRGTDQQLTSPVSSAFQNRSICKATWRLYWRCVLRVRTDPAAAWTVVNCFREKHSADISRRSNRVGWKPLKSPFPYCVKTMRSCLQSDPRICRGQRTCSRYVGRLFLWTEVKLLGTEIAHSQY